MAGSISSAISGELEGITGGDTKPGFAAPVDAYVIAKITRRIAQLERKMRSGQPSSGQDVTDLQTAYMKMQQYLQLLHKVLSAEHEAAADVIRNLRA